MPSFSVSFRTLDAPEAQPAGASGGAQIRVLDLAGELDAHTAPEFENALQSALDDGYARLIVAGDDLRYVSSAGLGVFMAFLEPVRAKDGDLKIAALSDEVFEVFDLLGFPLLFDLAPTTEDAAARFAPEAQAAEASGDAASDD